MLTKWQSGLIPSLDLQFTSDTIDGRTTYSGGAGGTYTDSTGVIRPQRGNAFTYSDDASLWGGMNGVSVSGTTQSPNGSSSGKLVESATNAGHYISRSVSSVPGAYATISVYAKAAERSVLVINPNNNEVNVVASYDLAGGVLGTVGAGITADIQSAGNGWYRCIATYRNTTASASVLFSLATSATNIGNVPVYAGDGTSGLYLWDSEYDPSGILHAPVHTTVAPIYAPRIDYDPVSIGSARGILVEEQRTNLLLNSKIDGTTLATQSVTVSAQAYTLSFYGTGTVTLSGTFTGSLVGSAVYPTRSTLTFTPTAGTLTLTVTGTVQYAQLEAGSFATSKTPTTSAQVTRTADSASLTGSNFSSVWGAAQGTVAATFDVNSATGTRPILSFDDGTANNQIRLYVSGTSLKLTATTAGVQQADLTLGTVAAGTQYKAAFSYAAGAFNAQMTGGTLQSGTGTVSTVTQMRIGADQAGNYQNGHNLRSRVWQRPVNLGALV